MLLALLILVAGRLGGALGGPPALAVEAVRSIGGGAEPGGPAPIGGESAGPGVELMRAGGPGGGADADVGGGGVPAPPGRDGARGGGGVAVFGA